MSSLKNAESFERKCFRILRIFVSVKREMKRKNEYMGEFRERNFKRQGIGVAFSNRHDDKSALHVPILACGLRPCPSPLNGGDTPAVL